MLNFDDGLGHNVAFADHGIREAFGEATLEAQSFYFSSTFIRVRLGDKVSIRVKNTSAVKHNFSVPEQNIDVDIPAGSESVVTVAIPGRPPFGGWPYPVLFGCKYDTEKGMNGQLLGGKAKPGPGFGHIINVVSSER